MREDKLIFYDTNGSESPLIGNDFDDEHEPPTMSASKKREVNNVFFDFLKLPRGWDGYEAISPYPESVDNAIKFLQRIPDTLIDKISEEHIYPTNYGTVVLDLFNGSEKISIEFGKTKIGFYTKFNGDTNWEINSTPFNYGSMPSDLISALTYLYKTYILD